MDSHDYNPIKKIICRLCAKESDKFFEVFDEQGMRWKIASIISTLFYLKLRKGDKYSQICHTCWWKIEPFHNFYLEIQAAQTFFAQDQLVECKDYHNINDNVPCKEAINYLQCTDETYNSNDEYLVEMIDEDCRNSNGSTDINDKLRKSELIIDVQSSNVVTKLDYESESESEEVNNQPKIHSNKNTFKRKRDNPLVLAEDDLIRSWCIMQCTKCPKLFGDFTFKDVKLHYHNEHGANGFLLCCDKKFFRRVRALEHIARHIDPSVFSCGKCSKSFSDKPALLNHLDGHVSPDKRPYKCNSCDHSFVRRYQLSQHQKLRHFSDEKKFVCEKCSKSFITKSILQSHVRSVHSNNSVLMCDVCAKTFKSKQCLQQHLLQHNGENAVRVQCGICSAWLKHQNSLRGHMARHIDALSEHVCKECGKKAPSRGALRSHQKYVHSNTKQFSCNLCAKAFKKSISLKEHIASCHTGEVLYHCPFCSKTFNSNANLCSHKKRFHQNTSEFIAS